MNTLMPFKEEVLRKSEELKKIGPILKAEFLGIDSVIDQVLESIRPFYIFPKSLKRPLVINLWGMTGTGKTSLVARIVELLNIEHKYCKFDVGEYANTSSDWKLKYDLSDKVQKCPDKHLILAFDEFQLGRTISEDAKEVDRSSLRPIWDMIDSGKLGQVSKAAFGAVEVARQLRKILEKEVVVEEGVVVTGAETYNSAFLNSYLRAIDFEPKETKDSKKKVKIDEHSTAYQQLVNSIANRDKMGNPYFIKYEHFIKLYEANPSFFNEVRDYERWKHIFREGMNGEAIVQLIYREFISVTPLMTIEDYSQSLIFCLGNIDEAYRMTHSSNPDADADVFYENSLKITLPKMKEALSQRFRMEQIGRLGNNHIIYPSFNKETYRKIINKNLETRIKEYKDDFGLDLKFDPTLHDIIYKESVFPSQGARPVISTISTLIDSSTSKIVADMISNIEDATSLTWKFDKESTNFLIEVSSDTRTEVFKYPVKLTIENLRRSDHSDRQAFVAVHEAGHAVLACMLGHIIPSEVRSRTAATAEGFCAVTRPEIVTKDWMLTEIAISLGGLEAERLIFGEDKLSDGTYSDISGATGLAAALIKSYGMGNIPYQVSLRGICANKIYGDKPNDDAESEAIKLVEEASKRAQKCLKENRAFLLELSGYLANKPVISQERLKKMAKKYTKDIRTSSKYYGFKKLLKDMQPKKVKNVSVVKKSI